MNICIFEKLAHVGYQDSFPLFTGTEELKERFDREGQEFLDRIITCDKTWVHHFTPESKRASKQWKHADSLPPKKFRAIASAGKEMASVFWDKRGVIHVDFLPRGVTINSEYYRRVLSDVRLPKKTAWFDH